MSPRLLAGLPALDCNVCFMHIYGTNDRSISINNAGILDSGIRPGGSIEFPICTYPRLERNMDTTPATGIVSRSRKKKSQMNDDRRSSRQFVYVLYIRSLFDVDRLENLFFLRNSSTANVSFFLRIFAMFLFAFLSLSLCFSVSLISVGSRHVLFTVAAGFYATV